MKPRIRSVGLDEIDILIQFSRETTLTASVLCPPHSPTLRQGIARLRLRSTLTLGRVILWAKTGKMFFPAHAGAPLPRHTNTRIASFVSRGRWSQFNNTTAKSGQELTKSCELFDEHPCSAIFLSISSTTSSMLFPCRFESFRPDHL